MPCVLLENIAVSSTSLDETKPLTHRWFTKHKVDHVKEENSANEKNSFITRYTIVTLSVLMGLVKI